MITKTAFTTFHNIPYLLLLYLLASLSPAAAFYCDGPPSAGCLNGMWDEATCKCECIPPYCPDIYGQCAATWVCNPTNPWIRCVPGENCPWWKNPLRMESCTTGPEVPPGIWEIHNTVEDCCRISYPYSNTCLPDEVKDLSPTPYPTMVKPALPDTETIMIKFSAIKLPLDVDIVAFREEFRNILKGELGKLAEKYDSLKILNVEQRNGRRAMTKVAKVLGATGSSALSVEKNALRRVNSEETKQVRTLQRDPEDMIFDITIARQEGVDYEPVIVNAIKENQDSIVDNIRKSNPKIQGSFDVCIQPRNGNGDAVCSLDGKETSSPTKLPISKPAPTPARPLKSNAEVEESNFPIWIIIVIVICLLFIICCVCGFVFYRRSHGEKGKNTDADKMERAATQPAEDDSDDDDSSSVDEQYTAKSRGMSTRRSTMPPQQQYMPVPPNLGMLAIHENQPFDQSQRVLALPNDPHQGSTVFVDDDISTLPDQSLRDIDAYTYAESATRPDPTMYSSRSKNKSKRNLKEPSVYTRRTTKDPSLYLENGSVADASGFIGGYSQYSKNDPSMYQGSVMSSVRGVQDPSVYYYGNNAQDPSVYRSGLNVEDPSVYYSGNNARDPSIYHGTSAAFDDPSYNPSSFRFPRAQEAMSMMSENSYSIYGKTDYSNTQSSMATDNKSRSGKKSKKSKKKKEQNRSKPLASIDS